MPVGDTLVFNALSLPAVSVEYFPENTQVYRARRLVLIVALSFILLFVGLFIFWVWRNATGSYPRLTVPPIGSGMIHLFLCLCVVLVYLIGTLAAPRPVTVGMRGGSLPSLVRRPNDMACALSCPPIPCFLPCPSLNAASPGAADAEQPVHEFVCLEQVARAPLFPRVLPGGNSMPAHPTVTAVDTWPSCGHFQGSLLTAGSTCGS